MANEARHHHYIPQCYLRGFSVGSGKKRLVTVASLEGARFFETNPRNVGGVRDFNRIEIPGFKPDALEGMLANFEGEVATAIRNVEVSRKFEGDDSNAILNLAALLAVRSPQMRESIRQFEERILKQVLGLSLATKERWENQLRQMKEAGIEVKDSLSYEDMKKFHDEGAYNIRLNREHHIKLEMATHDTVLRTMVVRKWRLCVAAPEAGCFVTSDRPVVLTWDKPNEIPAILRNSPGFGMPDTEVLFPLTQHMALVGAFDGKEGTEEVSSILIAAANAKMIGHAFEQIYTAKRTFPYVGPNMSYHHDRHFFEVMAPLRRRSTKDEAAATVQPQQAQIDASE